MKVPYEEGRNDDLDFQNGGRGEASLTIATVDFLILLLKFARFIKFNRHDIILYVFYELSPNMKDL